MLSSRYQSVFFRLISQVAHNAELRHQLERTAASRWPLYSIAANEVSLVENETFPVDSLLDFTTLSVSRNGVFPSALGAFPET